MHLLKFNTVKVASSDCHFKVKIRTHDENIVKVFTVQAKTIQIKPKPSSSVNKYKFVILKWNCLQSMRMQACKMHSQLWCRAYTRYHRTKMGCEWQWWPWNRHITHVKIERATDKKRQKNDTQRMNIALIAFAAETHTMPNYQCAALRWF